MLKINVNNERMKKRYFLFLEKNKKQKIYEKDKKRLRQALKITGQQLIDEKLRAKETYEQINQLRQAPKNKSDCKLSDVLRRPPWLYQPSGNARRP